MHAYKNKTKKLKKKKKREKRKLTDAIHDRDDLNLEC